jgi:PTH1 family peptidyl-tRNA hydrolase
MDYLLCGLGNPGPQYTMNRHNVGFLSMDVIADDYNLPGFRDKFSGKFTDGRIDGHRVACLKPMTYMNKSGQAVVECVNYYKISPDDIIIFHDDLDLLPGKIRVKQGGGSGGHNGLKSIARHIGPDFWRVRIGIGHPGDKNKVTPYVLSDFSTNEQNGWLGDRLDDLSRYLPELLDGNPNAYASKIMQDN